MVSTFRSSGSTESRPAPHAYVRWFVRPKETGMSELLEIGAPAPRFVASASDGKTYRLADLLKTQHVALIFYPGNDTPG